jgi:hypothetical protein
MKQPLFSINFQVSVDEFLSMCWCLRDVHAAGTCPYPPMKQTLKKMAREERRIWREYLAWKGAQRAARLKEKGKLESSP